LSVVNTLVSVALFTALFAAIYKVLPDTPIAWRDVRTGAFLTALMFTAGKSLIGWYLGTTETSSVRAIIPVRIRGDQSNRRCAVG
jgi:membrane protein